MILCLKGCIQITEIVGREVALFTSVTATTNISEINQ